MEPHKNKSLRGSNKPFPLPNASLPLNLRLDSSLAGEHLSANGNDRSMQIDDLFASGGSTNPAPLWQVSLGV